MYREHRKYESCLIFACWDIDSNKGHLLAKKENNVHRNYFTRKYLMVNHIIVKVLQTIDSFTVAS